MRSMTNNVPALPTTNDIAGKAAAYPFWATIGRVLLTAVLSVLITAGWLAGSTWFGVVFTILWIWSYISWAWSAVVLGYRKGAHVKTGGERSGSASSN